MTLKPVALTSKTCSVKNSGAHIPDSELTRENTAWMLACSVCVTCIENIAYCAGP